MPSMEYAWYILRSEPNRESTAAAGLVSYGLESYLPKVKVQQRPRRGASRSVLRPMFVGYLFAWSSPRDPLWARLWNLPGLRGALKVGGALATITPEQLNAVREKESELINTKAPSGPTYKTGDTVRMVDGPFAGQLVGISALDDAGRITVLMQLFGRQTKTVVSQKQIERV